MRSKTLPVFRFAALLTLILAAGCGRAMTSDTWVLLSYDDTGTFMDSYVAKDLVECRDLKGERWLAAKARAVFACGTQCTRHLSGEVTCGQMDSN